MSTGTGSSPHSNAARFLPQAAFKKNVVEDPYLSEGISLESEFDIISQGSARGSAISDILPGAATLQMTNNESPMMEHAAGGLLHELNFDITFAMPSQGFLSPDLPPEIDESPYENTSAHPSPRQTAIQLPENHLQPSQGTLDASSQLLSPDLTNHPSPTSDCAPAIGAPRQSWQKNPLTLTIPSHPNIPSSPSSHSVNLGVCAGRKPRQATSPVVQVSTYHRGDSPTRGKQPRGRAGSSTGLLSAGYLNGSRSDESGGEEETLPFPTLGSPTVRANDGSWHRDVTTGQAGIQPAVRGNIYVPSPSEMEEKRHRAEKNADIENWSASVSAANSDAGDEIPPYETFWGRHHRRARSVGAPPQQDYFNYHPSQAYVDDSKIPGPGLLIDERSEMDSDLSEGGSGATDAWSESPIHSVHHPPDGLREPEGPEEEDPLPRQFLLQPWHDSPRYYPLPIRSRMQPQSSIDAISKFNQQASNFETASRSATWGTGGRMTESDAGSLRETHWFTRHLSLHRSKKPDKHIHGIRKLLPKRSNSTSKRKSSDASPRQSSIEPPIKDVEEKEKLGENVPKTKPSFQHRLSLSRSKSPSHNAGGTSIAVGGPMPPIAGGISVQPGSPSLAVPSSGPPFKGRSRSSSDLPKGSKPGLRNQFSHFVSAFAKPSEQSDAPMQCGYAGDEDEEDGEAKDEKGVRMTFALPSRPILPTLEGFKEEILQLNPRIDPALVDRFAQEQVRRYRKLFQEKQKHAQAVGQGSCNAGKHCFALGGEATLLPPRTSARDPSTMCVQFQIPGNDASGDESNTFVEGVVTPALFPTGVPLPPVRRLPAEFECSLCFKVKKFQKPSDWTKHVHEDVQPFTCTFPHCTEPKSFKRKADWVRHENERHRQLEWWTCNMPDCHHQCYRKDNFVQHLVREHKKPEPKIKKGKPTAPNGGINPDLANGEEWDDCPNEQEIQQLWHQVEKCRHDSPKRPQDERCRFCGNVCSSWKKLTVHLAKHMEQIAMPVIQLVEDRAMHPTSGTDLVPSSQMRSASPVGSVSQPVTVGLTNIKVEQGLSVSGSHAVHRDCEGSPGNLNPAFGQTGVLPFSSQYSIPNDLVAPLESRAPCRNGSPTSCLATSSSMSQSLNGYSTSYHPVIYNPAPLNPVSYPPHYNGMPRQETAQGGNSPPDAATDSFALTVSNLGSHTMYEPHQRLYSPPSGEDAFGYPNDQMIMSVSYDETADGMGYPGGHTHGLDSMPPSSTYIPGNGSLYQLQ